MKELNRNQQTNRKGPISRNIPNTRQDNKIPKKTRKKRSFIKKVANAHKTYPELKYVQILSTYLPEKFQEYFYEVKIYKKDRFFLINIEYEFEFENSSNLKVRIYPQDNLNGELKTYLEQKIINEDFSRLSFEEKKYKDRIRLISQEPEEIGRALSLEYRINKTFKTRESLEKTFFKVMKPLFIYAIESHQRNNRISRF